MENLGEYDVYEYIEQFIRRFTDDVAAFYEARPSALEYMSYEEFVYYVDSYLGEL